jgi:hypothetical protein
MEAGDLTNAISVGAKPANHTADHQTRMIDALSQTHEIGVGGEQFNITCQIEQRILFRFGQHRTRRQALKEKTKGNALTMCHASTPA